MDLARLDRPETEEPERPPAWRQMVEALLPPAPPAGRLFGYLAGFLAAVGFQLLIPAGLTRLDHIWAEDGARFLVDGLTEPFASNLVSPYDGYLHTLPRLVAELMSVLPLGWAPVVVAVLAAMLRAGIAVLVYAASGGYLRSVPVRAGLAALVVVLPAANSETLGNLANLHWFLLYGAFWALLWRPRSRGLSILAALVVGLAAVSSPLVFLLLPLALLRFGLAAWRDRLSAIVFGVGLVAQAVAVLSATRVPRSAQPVDPVQVLLASLLRVPVVAFTGSEQVAHVYPRFGNAPVLAALLLAVVPVAAAVVRGGGPRRFLALLGTGYGGLVIVIVLAANWSTALQVQQESVVMAAQRYSVLPCLFLFTAIAAGLDVLPVRPWERATVWAARLAVLLAVLVSVGLHLRVGGGRLDGTPWDVSVTRARQECAEGRPDARLVHEPPGWFFVVPCDHLPK